MPAGIAAHMARDFRRKFRLNRICSSHNPTRAAVKTAARHAEEKWFYRPGGFL